jgi:hypothetical protein
MQCYYKITCWQVCHQTWADEHIQLKYSNTLSNIHATCSYRIHQHPKLQCESHPTIIHAHQPFGQAWPQQINVHNQLCLLLPNCILCMRTESRMLHKCCPTASCVCVQRAAHLTSAVRLHLVCAYREQHTSQILSDCILCMRTESSTPHKYCTNIPHSKYCPKEPSLSTLLEKCTSICSTSLSCHRRLA